MKKMLMLLLCCAVAKWAISQQTFFSTYTIHEWSMERHAHIVQTPNGFLVISRMYDQVSGAHIGIGKFDVEGNLLEMHRHNNLYYYHVNQKPTKDGCYLITGNVDVAGIPIKAFLAKMNQNGELVWLRTYEMAPRSTIGISAHELDNGDLILNLDLTTTMQVPHQAEKRVVRTDAEGYVLSYTDYPDPHRISKSGKMELLSTGEWLMYFYAIPWNSSRPRLAMRKLDANFEEIWTRSYFRTDLTLSPALVRELPDNRYMIVGFQDTFIPFKGSYKIVQLITDSSGQPLQEKLLYAKPYVVFCNNIQETPDGNFIGVGGALYPNPPNGSSSWELPWVLKFNTNGEILWERHLYLNDSTQYFNGTGHPIFYLIDLLLQPDGRIAISGEIQLDKTRPPDGLLLMLDENGCLHPQLGCDDSLQPILLSSSAPPDRQPDWVQVWPNPATDVLFCRNMSERPLLLRLHDALGRVALEFGLKPREDTRILTSHLPPGAYWLYAETPDGHFFTTKIILQP